MRILFLVNLVLLIVVSNSFAMDMPVAIDATADDSVGKRLVYQIKEGINRSTSMHITLEEELGMGLKIVTLEGDRDTPGNYTTYSVTWTWINPEQVFPFYLTSSVGVCGSSRVESVAESLVADTHETAETILKMLMDYEESRSTSQGN